MLKRFLILILGLTLSAPALRAQVLVAGENDPQITTEEARPTPGAPRQQQFKNLTEAQLQKLISVIAMVEMGYKDEVTTEQWDEIIDKMLKTAVESLGDPHTHYYDEKEFQALVNSLQQQYVGIGAVLAEDPAGAKIDVIFPGSPAEKAGLQPGDIIVTVNTPDGPIQGAGKKPGDLIPHVVGDEGTDVTLTIKKADGSFKNVTLTRAAVHMPNVFGRKIDSNVGYVYFNQFGPDTDTKVFAEIDKLLQDGVGSLIIDLRDNGGGRTDIAASIISEFLSNGDQIMTTRRQGNVTGGFKAAADGSYKGLPVAILVNGNSASASEITSGTLQDYRAATVIGEQTYGKGTQQTVQGFPDGSGIKMTTDNWFTGGQDRLIQGTYDENGEMIPNSGGVTPDIVVATDEDTAKQIREQRMLDLFGRPLAGNRVADPVIGEAVRHLTPKALQYKGAQPIKQGSLDTGYVYGDDTGYAWAE